MVGLLRVRPLSVFTASPSSGLKWVPGYLETGQARSALPTGYSTTSGTQPNWITLTLTLLLAKCRQQLVWSPSTASHFVSSRLQHFHSRGTPIWPYVNSPSRQHVRFKTGHPCQPQRCAGLCGNLTQSGGSLRGNRRYRRSCSRGSRPPRGGFAWNQPAAFVPRAREAWGSRSWGGGDD